MLPTLFGVESSYSSVLLRLLGSSCGSSSGLSPGFFPFRGPAPVSRLFLSLRPRRSRSPIPSLAPSRWSPCPLLRWALLMLSCYVLSVPSAFSLLRSRLSIPFAMSPLSRRVFAEGIRPLRAVALAGGVSPFVGFRRSPWGLQWLHLHRLTLVLVSLRDLDVCRLELRLVFHAFPARRSACIHGDKFVSLPDLYVYQPQQSRWVMLFGHLPCRVTGLTWSSPPRTSRTPSIALTYGLDNLLRRHPAIDIVCRWPCLPRFRLL